MMREPTGRPSADSTALCLALALLFCAPQARPAGADRAGEEGLARERDRVYRDAREVMVELAPLVGELNALCAKETEASDPAPFIGVRERLRPRIEKLTLKLKWDHDEWLTLNRQVLIMKGARAIWPKRLGGGKGGVEDSLGTALDTEETSRRMTTARNEAARALGEEDAAAEALAARFSCAQQTAEIRRLGLGGCAVVGLLLLAVRLARRR